MAGETIDLRIAELLAARCVITRQPDRGDRQRLEILGDEPDFAADAGALIELSARQASRRLQFYRVAYGSTTVLAEELVCRAAVDFFAEGKVAWTGASPRCRRAGKSLLAIWFWSRPRPCRAAAESCWIRMVPVESS